MTARVNAISELGRSVQEIDSTDGIAQQILARVRARVAGEPVPPLNYGGYEDPVLHDTGGMGLVYRARDPELDRIVAIKLVRYRNVPHADLRLRREARAMAKVVHPNIVHVYEAGRLDDGQGYMAMQFVDGPNLRVWCTAAPRTWRAVRDMFCQAGRGLAAAHAAGIVHRDFKPENVLVDAGGVARVTDFGLATVKPSGEADGLHSTAGGTLVYAAPECLNGEPGDARCDQFSFCVALYEALFVHPFVRAGEGGGGAAQSSTSTSGGAGSTQKRGLDRELCRRIFAGEIATPADHHVPGRVIKALRRGLKGDPAARFPDMPKLLAALEDEPWARRRNWMISGGLGIGLVAALVRPVAARSCDVEPELLGAIEAPEELAGALMRARVPMAVQRARSLGELLREHAGAIADEREKLCEERRAPIAATAVLDGRARCLDDARRRLVATSNSFLTGDAGRVEQATVMLAELPRPEDCRFDAYSTCRLVAPGPAGLAIGGELELAWAAELRGDYPTATAAAGRAARQAERLGLKGPMLVARQHLGRLYFEQENFDAATAELLAARDLALSLGCAPQAADALEFLTKIGAHSPAVELELADDWSRAQVALTGEIGDAWRQAAAANARGLLQLFRHRDLDAAERSFRAALAQRERSTSRRQNIDRAYTLLNLGSVAAARDEREAADRLTNAGLADLAGALGPRNPLAARFLFNLAEGAIALEDLEAASRHLAVAESLAREGAADGTLLADIVRAQALLAERRGTFSLGVTLADEAMDLAARKLSRTDPRYFEFVAAATALRISAGRTEEASRLLERAIVDSPPETRADLLQQLAEIESEQEKYPAALAHIEKALASYTSDPERDPRLLPHLEYVHAEALAGVERDDDAIAPLRRALAGFAEGPPEKLVNTNWLLAQVLARRPGGVREACMLATAAVTEAAGLEGEDVKPVIAEFERFLKTHRCTKPKGHRP